MIENTQDPYGKFPAAKRDLDAMDKKEHECNDDWRRMRAQPGIKYIPSIEDPRDVEARATEDYEDRSFESGYTEGVQECLCFVVSSKMGHPLVVAQLQLLEDAMRSLLLPGPEPKRINP